MKDMAWNRPDPNAPLKIVAKESANRLLIIKISIGVVATGIAAVIGFGLLLSDSKSKPSPKLRAKSISAIQRPLTPPKSGGTTNDIPPEIKIPTPPEAEKLSEKDKWGHPQLVTDVNGTMWFRGAKVPVETAGTSRRKGKPWGQQEHFRKITDRYLAALFLSGAITGPSSAAGKLSDKFYAAMEASLDDPVEFSRDDTPEARAQKEDMVELKKILKERLAAGEKLRDIIEAANRDSEKVAGTRQNFERMYHELVNDNKSTLKDVQEFLEAANSILKNNNALPLKMAPGAHAKLEIKESRLKEVKGE